MQKHLQTLCDREDDESSEKSFVSAQSYTQRLDTKSRHTNHDTSSKQRTISEVDLVDSSSNDLFPKNANSSHKKDKQSKSERDQKAKSIRDSSNHSTQKVSRPIVREKSTSRRYKMSSDSSDSTDSSAKTNPEMYKYNVKSEKIVKRKPNSSRVYSSGSESDETDTKRASSKSKKISKDTKQNKKMDHSYNAESKDKETKDYDSTSESEDEHEKGRKEKRSETNQLTPHNNNDERKRNKSLMKSRSNIEEDDSDNSSSKEFQKIKLQKVNRNKYSTRQLINLEIDHTKTPVKNSNDKSKKHMSKQSNENLNDIKQILRDCKKMCSNFQMYIETIEQLHGKKEDEERLIMKSTEKIVKLRTMLKEKEKDLTISYQAWRNRKKSATKRHKVISDDEQSSEEKRTVDEAKQISEDEQDENKAVSECDSEEIFSGNETKTPQKTRETQPKADTSRTKNSLNNSGISSTDDEDGMDKLKNNDKNNEVNMCNVLATSPVFDLKGKKTSAEQLSKKQLFSENAKSKEAQLTDENTNTTEDKQANLNTNTYNNETAIEDSTSKDSSKKRILENDETDQTNCINESLDMFDTSFEDATEAKIEKTNCDKGKLSKDKFSDSCKSSLQDKVPSEKEKIFLLSSDIGEEKDLLNQNDQEVSALSKEVHDSSKISTPNKTNTDDYESLDDAEALAKKALLATDSDTSDTFDNVPKLTEDLITNNTNQIEKKNEIKDDDSDVNSVSTVMLSTFIKKTNTDVKKDTSIEAKTEVKEESDNRLSQDTNSTDEEAKAEKAAKKALLESNSDDSTFLSSESEKLTEDKKSELDFSQKNTRAKLALLASSSDNSSSEPVQSEMTNVSKSTKRNHEPGSDGESVVVRSKKRRLKHNENHHYKNDKKLRMSCEVHLTRLNADVLKCYSRALRKSREYLARKAFKRYQEFSVKPISVVLHRLT